MANPEGYQPSPAEISDAESSMNPYQEEDTENREGMREFTREVLEHHLPEIIENDPLAERESFQDMVEHMDYKNGEQLDEVAKRIHAYKKNLEKSITNCDFILRKLRKLDIE